MKNNIFNKTILTIFALALCFFVYPNKTEAFFAPEKSSTDNVFEVGTLSFLLSETDLLLGIDSTSTSTSSFEIEDTGDISSTYEIVAEKVSCEDNFYNGIFLNVDNGVTIYENTLSGLNATTTTDGMIEFSIGAMPNLVADNGDECEVNLHIKAWQSNFTEFDSGRFSQEEVINLKITATENIGGSVVLNEILPNPEGLDSQGGLQGEWVELYNLSSSPVDLTDWYIKDEDGNTVYITATSTLNGRTTIGVPGSSLEWLVVFMTGEIMDNTGDTVYFYDNNDILYDSYTFGGSVNDADSDSNNTPQGDNESPSGSETSAQEGKSDARIPDGIGDWIDPIPTPGSPNVIEEIEENIDPETEEEADVLDSEENVIIDPLANEENSDKATTTPETSKSDEDIESTETDNDNSESETNKGSSAFGGGSQSGGSEDETIDTKEDGSVDDKKENSESEDGETSDGDEENEDSESAESDDANSESDEAPENINDSDKKDSFSNTEEKVEDKAEIVSDEDSEIDDVTEEESIEDESESSEPNELEVTETEQ